MYLLMPTHSLTVRTVNIYIHAPPRRRRVVGHKLALMPGIVDEIHGDVDVMGCDEG